MKLITNMLIAILLTLTFSSCGDSSLDNLEAPPAAAPEINTAPIANAGVDQNVTQSAIVTLTALASSDEQGDALTYTWSMVSTATGSSAVLSSTTSANPTFIPDVVGVYSIKLSVNDGSLDSETEDTVYVIATSAPVANAGVDQNVNTTSSVLLDASSSSVSTGKSLTYVWTIRSKPTSSSAVLSVSTIVNPTFTADIDGTYIVELVVNDGTVDSAMDSVSITAQTANSAPVANAGSDQNVLRSAVVNMDGSTSSDADNDSLTYSWTIASKPSLSTASLSDGSVVNPSFTADLSGSYVLELVVNDGSVDSVADSVTVSATQADLPPEANAGSNQNVSTLDVVQLDASLSSANDGITLTYTWQMTSKPVNSFAQLSSTSLVSPTFTADVEGAYVFSLMVNDGVEDSSYDYVTINAADANVGPTSNAGVDQNVKTSTIVGLDGSLSADANLDALVYEWVMISKPSTSIATLSSSSVVNPSFNSDIDGAYVFQLIVTDGEFFSTADYVTVQAETTNSIPRADASSDQNVITLSEVTLNGSSSSDADKDHLAYIWHIVSKPIQSIASLSNPSVVNPSFTADKDGTYVVQLVVNDGITNSPADTVVITSTTTNAAPTAVIGNNQNVKTGATVIVDASTSYDPDFDVLTYTWVVASKPSTSNSFLSDPRIVNPVFTADVDGAYVLGVSVNDGTLESDRVYTTIVATKENSVPIADAGVDRDETIGVSFDLNATASSDADSEPLTYSWNIISTPLDANGSYSSVSTLSSKVIAEPSFIADVVGSYVFELIVNDGKVDSAADYVTVDAQ